MQKLLFTTIFLFVLSVSAFAAEGQWSPDKAAAWQKETGWLNGINYITSESINSVEMFDKSSFLPDLIDKELTLAEGLGFNFARVLVPYAVYEDDAEYLLKVFDQFLGICDKHHIKVMPVLFDDCTFSPDFQPKAGKQSDRKVGWYAWAWSPSPGGKLVTDEAAHPKLEKYVKDFIGRFKNDKRIVIWDVYNEPTNGGLGNKTLPLLAKVFRWAREAEPSQPITVGAWNGNAELNKIIIDNSDVISFHIYADLNRTRAEVVKWKSFNRPVICTEWMHRPNKSTVEDILPLLKAENVGSTLWGLVNGKTQTHLTWGHRPEMLPYKGLWQHDLFHFDFSPYNQKEIDVIKNINAEKPPTAGQWTTEKANEWYKKHTPILGCNFLPSTAVNDVEMWQSSTIDFDTMDKELGLLKQFGINSVRVFLNYVVWEAEPDKLKANFRNFLDLCEKHQISVMPILFDRCNFSNLEATFGNQPDPIPGVHNSRWVSSPPQKMMNKPEFDEQLKAYLQDIIKTFKDDKRVIIWDLYNEPEQNGQTHPLMEKAFVWAREVAPSQPLTVGPWTGDFMSNPIAKREMELSDIVSFHAYDSRAEVERKIIICSLYGRPLVCTEWLNRQRGNTPKIILPLFKEYNVGGYNWGCVAGRTQTYFPWGSKPNTPEPKVWQHDLFRKDGTPYQKREVALFRDFAGLEPLVDVKEITLIPAAANDWRSTETEPSADWKAITFNDSSWKTSKAPFGVKESAIGREPATVWSGKQIFLRKTFELDEATLNRVRQDGLKLELDIYYDEFPVIYLNGKEVANINGYNADYETRSLAADALNLLQKGKNVLAIKCSQTTGGQFIDVGLFGR